MDATAKSKSVKSILTVRHSKDGNGMGVLLDNHRVVTAAHCLPALPDRHLTPYISHRYIIQLRQFGTKKWARCVTQSVDFCSDVAVLGDSTIGGADLFDHQFEIMANSMESASVNLLEKDHGKKQDVYVFTHEGLWLTAELDLSQPYMKHRPTERIAGASLLFDGEIKGGTSGSPVFDNNGAVIGIVSEASVPQAQEKQHTTITVLAGALPRWIASEIAHAQI